MVQQRLSPAAFTELETIREGDTDGIQAWALRWNVHAPCILQAAVGWCDGFRVDSYADPEPPPDWRVRLHHICQLPPMVGPHLGVSVIDNQEQRAALEALEALRRQVETAAAQRASDPAISRCMHTAIAACERYLRGDELPRRRREAAHAAVEHALHPLVADPSRESRAEFWSRVRLHWAAMDAEARRFGVVYETRAARELDRDIQWLDIAATEGTTEVTVRKAVERLAELLNLRRRDTP
jgi:hypothetical protein